jgi:DNA repair exonuclease SbcCD ATPase subunit
VDLYALPPEDFTAARDAAAKEDKSLKALRKPSVSAWVVNTLTREQPDLLQQLVELGGQLREATQARQGEELRALTEQRHQLVQAVTEQAVGLVDREISAPVRTEVAQTLEAAMADPASAEAVQSGQLVRALSYAGFGEVDLEGAVAAVPKPKAAGSKKLQKLEAAALDAQGALDDAVRLAERTTRAYDTAAEAGEAAERDVAEHEQMAEELREQLKEAERALQDARSRHSAARKELEDLQRKAERATKAVSEAQEAWDRARSALVVARRSP